MDVMKSLEIWWELNTPPAYLASTGPDFLSSLVASLNSGNRNVHVLADGSEQLRCFVLLCTGVFVFFRGVYNLVVSVDIFGPSIGS